MDITCKNFTYRWIADWAKLPPMTGHSHHGLTIAKDGTIVTGHATDPVVLMMDDKGNVKRSFPVPVGETHCLCLTDNDQALWIADVDGFENGKPRVIKVDMNGKLLAEINREAFGYADDEKFTPTALDVDPSTGDLWITDGYGSSRTHKFNKDLKKVVTIDGTAGAGRFNCPHWVFVDRRTGVSEIYIADRGNDRVQIYSPDGTFLRAITTGLTAPSVFSSFKDTLVIGELKARLVLLDKNDAIIGYLGAGVEHCAKPGWPNRQNAAGERVSPLNDIPIGQFNSPHGVAADAKGNIYISEWLLGDRFTKLELVNA